MITKQKVAIFGIGTNYKRISNELLTVAEVVVFIDNDKNNQGKKLNEIPIISPKDLKPDTVENIIVTSNKYAIDIEKQLIALGVKKNKIWYCDDFLQSYRQGKITLIYQDDSLGRVCVHGNKATKLIESRALLDKSILLISYHANYDGGSLAAIYAVMALKSCGYYPVLAVPSIDDKLLEEIIQKGICVAICPNLINPSEVEMDWIGHWQRIIVNTLPMSHATLAIGKRQKVIVWLHESPEVYEAYEYFHDDFQRAFDEKNVYVYAVSRVARDNFLKYYRCDPNSIGILPYGLPDEHIVTSNNGINRPMTFALIGSISKGKGVDIYLDAIEKVNKVLANKPNNAEFLLIGKNNGNEFAERMLKRVFKIPNIRYLGQKDREKMNKLYRDKIDVVVVASRNETMSMTATEAMMFRKPSIVSDTSGISDFITDNYDGFVFKSENSDELATKIVWCINNSEKLEGIGAKGRKIYESEFIMKAFSKRLTDGLMSRFSTSQFSKNTDASGIETIKGGTAPIDV